MAYAYPAPRTGTAQDLFRAVTRAYELELERSGTRLPEKSEAARRWVEPWFRALGVALAKVLEVAPADWVVAFHERVFRSFSAPRSYPFDPGSPVVARARALAADLETRTGRAPALLALISHPPVMGDLAHLNFELVRRATLVLRELRGRPCRPRLVVAIDPFALDTTSIAEEGFYAGFMGSFHLGIDRLVLGRGRPGTALTPEAAWAAMPRRLLRVLSRGGEVGLVLSGGVPSTGRVLYGVREWARSVRAFSPLRDRPADAERALRAEPSFARFTSGPASSALPPAWAWRLLDVWLMTAAAGLLPGESVQAAAAAALSCLEVPEAQRPGLLADLARDLERETPRRRRLFRLLAGRVARRRPLLMIPVVHGTSPLGVSTLEAWSWEWAGPGRVVARRAGAPGDAVETTPEAFAERFVEENFK
jgi:hypothetical protein